ncbi:MAG: hypothetical protein HY305_05170, partial [Sphingobacteriales bacterium]|nr:hypothetical protein [Sphingobacteriales bacterium]
MKIKILLSTALLAISSFAIAQDANKVYAITSEGKGDFSWKNIRQFNLLTGEVNDVLLNGKDELIVAAAFDKKQNRLFYATKKTGQLSWIDFKTLQPTSSSLSQQNFNTKTSDADEAGETARMCIGADGNGYAISNDADHLYQFSTGNVVITDLGNLIDAESNQGISIHNKCTSWGGDMIADAAGKLYVISGNGIVFSVDIATRTATYIGSVKGLPASYTTNGAAVDKAGNIIVSSANAFEGLYSIDFNGL